MTVPIRSAARILERCDALARCSDDENLLLDDLHAATEVVALALYDLLTAETPPKK